MLKIAYQEILGFNEVEKLILNCFFLATVDQIVYSFI